MGNQTAFCVEVNGKACGKIKMHVGDVEIKTCDKDDARVEVQNHTCAIKGLESCKNVCRKYILYVPKGSVLR